MASLSVGLITCWYKNISVANYSHHLKSELEKLKVDVKIITSRCLCEERYVGDSDAFQSECRYVSWPIVPFLKPSSRELQGLMWFPHNFFQLLRGIKYLRQCRDCDVIHYQQSAPFSFGTLPLLGLLLIPTRKAKIVTIHSFDRFMVRRLYRFLNKFYLLADCIIVHSNEQKMEAIRLGLPEDRLEVVYHGAPNVKRLSVKRKEITFFGAPQERKGFFTILQALKVLKDLRRSICLSIYGIYSEKEKEIAMVAARRLDVADMLHWGGRLSEDDFDKKMQESLFTLAVYSMAIPGSSIITRAMVNAAPVIASNVGGSKEYLGKGGITIPPNDPATLAKTMATLLDDDKLRRQLSEHSMTRGTYLLSWRKIARKTLGIYLEAMQRGKDSRTRNTHVSGNI